MSGVAIIRQLLADRAEMLAVLPAAKVIAGTIPQNTVLPALGVSEVSSNEQWTTARNLRVKMIRERVQVTIQAKDYSTMKRLLKVASLGAGVHTGMVKGISVRSVLPDGVGPEIPVGDDGIYEQSRDFMVTFIEAN